MFSFVGTEGKDLISEILKIPAPSNGQACSKCSLSLSLALSLFFISLSSLNFSIMGNRGNENKEAKANKSIKHNLLNCKKTLAIL